MTEPWVYRSDVYRPIIGVICRISGHWRIVGRQIGSGDSVYGLSGWVYPGSGWTPFTIAEVIVLTTPNEAKKNSSAIKLPANWQDLAPTHEEITAYYGMPPHEGLSEPWVYRYNGVLGKDLIVVGVRLRLLRGPKDFTHLVGRVLNPTYDTPKLIQSGSSFPLGPWIPFTVAEIIGMTECEK